MKHLKKFKLFEGLTRNVKTGKYLDPINQYSPGEGEDGYEEWEEGQDDLNMGLARGDYDQYQQGYKKQAEILKKVGYSEKEIDQWCDNKADGFDNY